MSTTQPDANESIEPRTERALTEYMTVTPDLGRARGADGLALVTTQSESTYLVDYDAGRCECPDAEYNLSDGEVCKHVLRARFAVGETPVPAAAAAQLSVDGTLGDATDATVRFTAADGGVVPAGDDAVLYLWATAPKLPEAVDVLEAWGFEYTTNLVWDKEKMGMGYWSRVQHEHLLIGTRGDVSPPATDERRRSVIREERGKHSSKPDTAAEMISSQHENADLIELFARDARDGWDSWGNEAPEEVADD